MLEERLLKLEADVAALKQALAVKIGLTPPPSAPAKEKQDAAEEKGNP